MIGSWVTSDWTSSRCRHSGAPESESQIEGCDRSRPVPDLPIPKPSFRYGLNVTEPLILAYILTDYHSLIAHPVADEAICRQAKPADTTSIIQSVLCF
jgi:hypothetical protein